MCSYTLPLYPPPHAYALLMPFHKHMCTHRCMPVDGAGSPSAGAAGRMLTVESVQDSHRHSLFSCHIFYLWQSFQRKNKAKQKDSKARKAHRQQRELL